MWVVVWCGVVLQYTNYFKIVAWALVMWCDVASTRRHTSKQANSQIDLIFREQRPTLTRRGKLIPLRKLRQRQQQQEGSTWYIYILSTTISINVWSIDQIAHERRKKLDTSRFLGSLQRLIPWEEKSLFSPLWRWWSVSSEWRNRSILAALNQTRRESYGIKSKFSLLLWHRLQVVQRQ